MAIIHLLRGMFSAEPFYNLIAFHISLFCFIIATCFGLVNISMMDRMYEEVRKKKTHKIRILKF